MLFQSLPDVNFMYIRPNSSRPGDEKRHFEFKEARISGSNNKELPCSKERLQPPNGMGATFVLSNFLVLVRFISTPEMFALQVSDLDKTNLTISKG